MTGPLTVSNCFTAMDPVARPIFVVGTPQAGTAFVFRALGELPGVFALSPRARFVFDRSEELRPALRGHDSSRRTAADATPEAVERIRAQLAELVRAESESGGETRIVDGAPRHSLRIPFLDAVFPDATFVYVYRSPRDSIAAMVEAWRSQQFVTHPNLPGWEGPRWSMLLIPGWRELVGKSLPEIATAQWATATRIMIDDLESLPPDRWAVVDFAALVDDPAGPLERLAEVLGLEWDDAPGVGSPFDHLVRPTPGMLRELEPDLQRLLPGTIGLAEAAHDLLAAPVSRRPTATPDFEAATRSIHTAGFARLLDRREVSLLLTTGSTGKLVCVRHDGARVNTHFEDVADSRAVAASASEFAVVSGDELLRFGDEGSGRFVLDEREPAHGAAALAYAGSELYSGADPGRLGLERDGWQITGIAVDNGAPAYVATAPELGEGKGGRIVECAGGRVVAEGLGMPTGMILYEDRLWVVEHEPSRLVALDPDTGERTATIELPAPPGGIAVSGSAAFVALSEPASGVAVVDLARAQLGPYLRFEAEVPEIVDVAVLPSRYPEIVLSEAGLAKSGESGTKSPE
jgi:hypothetical protein